MLPTGVTDSTIRRLAARWGAAEMTGQGKKGDGRTQRGQAQWDTRWGTGGHGDSSTQGQWDTEDGDSGTWGIGAVGHGTAGYRNSGTRDMGTRGHKDSGTWGMGTVGHGVWRDMRKNGDGRT